MANLTFYTLASYGLCYILMEAKVFNFIRDKVTKIKLSEVTTQIARLSKGSTVKDKQVLGMMRYYQLLKEVKETCKCEDC